MIASKSCAPASSLKYFGEIRFGLAVNPAMISCASDVSGATDALRTDARRREAVCADIADSGSLQARLRVVDIVHEPKPAELPARVWIEKIPIARTRMAGRRGVRASAQDHLIDHEFSV